MAPALVLGLLAATGSAAAAPSTLRGTHVVVDVESPRGAHTQSWLRLPSGRHVRLRLAGPRPPAHQPLTATGTVDGRTLRVARLRSGRATTSRRAAPAIGRRSVLVLLATAGAADEVTPELAEAAVGVSAGGWFGEASAGQLDLAATATPWLRIATPPCAAGGAAGLYAALAEARAAAEALGYVPADYDHELLYVPAEPSCPVAGLAERDGRVSWLMGRLTRRLVVHELGHNLGLGHAHAVLCQDSGTPVPLSETCRRREYGDPYDVMGYALGDEAPNLNAPHQDALGWLTGRTVTVEADAVVDLVPLGTPTGPIAARVVTAGREYWIEYRQPVGFDAALPAFGVQTDGVVVHTADPDEGPDLLDLRPGTLPAGGFSQFFDAPLPVGNAWTTPEGVTVTAEAAGEAGASVRIGFPAG